jgi:hypothetical protein
LCALIQTTLPALTASGAPIHITNPENLMSKRLPWLAIVSTLMFGNLAFAQYPMLDMAANKVIQKYQNSSCEQLWQEKVEQQGRPKPQREQDAIQFLRNDPKMRAMFIDKVAPTVVNKMFECGMIP